MKSILKKFRKYKVGIALSGGGARGIAHLGVLKALHEADIYPEVISGVSAGAIAGVYYADGKSPDEILKIFTTHNLFNFVSFSIPRTGLMRISGLSATLEKTLNASSFEELQLPLYVAATDLNEGKLVLFSEGELIHRIVASSSIPVLFSPAQIDGKSYVDGGVFQNLPVEPLENYCKKVIGVHVNPHTRVNHFTSLFKIAERSLQLTFATSVEANKQKCDLFIQPDGLWKYRILDVGKAQEIFDVGYYETKEMLEQLDKKII